MKCSEIAPRFVQYIPEQLVAGVLYVSREYATATHLCCCGCGEEVVTPLNRTDWSLTMEDGRVTLFPSIGNWSFACRSHYWIERGRVIDAGPMEQWRIDRIRAVDFANKDAHFRAKNNERDQRSVIPAARPPSAAESTPGLLASLWEALRRWLS